MIKRYLLSILFLTAVFSIGANPALAKSSPADFGSLPSIHDIAISPDGNKLAVFVNNKGTYVISVITLEGGKMKAKGVQLSSASKPKWIRWANNERVLAGLWQSAKSGTTAYRVSGIYTIDAETMKGKYLIKPKHRQFRQFNDDVIDFLEHDPNHILMSFSDTNSNAPDIQRVNVATGKSQRVKKGAGNIQQWYTDNRGEPRIGQGRKETVSANYTMIIRDADGDKWRNVNEFPGLEADSSIRGFTDNPNEVIVASYNNRDTVGLYVYDLTQKSFTRTLFHNDQYDAGSLIINAEGKPIGAVYLSDAKERVLFAGSDTVISMLQRQFPNEIVDYIDQSENGRRVVFRLSSARDPGTLNYYDQVDKKIVGLGEVRTNLNLDNMGHVLSAKYKARDGQEIPGYMTVPAKITSNSQIKNLPFIVLPHGGPYARDSKRFDYLAQYFSSNGYGVFQMNFRGSAGYGKQFQDAGRENWVAMQEDVEDATNWLISKGYADPKRVCIAGWSYGGYAALMGGIKNPEMYRCIISIAGVTDLGDMINDLRKYRFGRVAAKDFILKGFASKDARKANSPVKRASEIKAPVLLAHGSYDQQVHYDQYTRMKKSLSKNKVVHTALGIKKEDHYFSNQENRIKLFEAMDTFLKAHLGASEFAP